MVELEGICNFMHMIEGSIFWTQLTVSFFFFLLPREGVTKAVEIIFMLPRILTTLKILSGGT